MHCVIVLGYSRNSVNFYNIRFKLCMQILQAETSCLTTCRQIHAYVVEDSNLLNHERIGSRGSIYFLLKSLIYNYHLFLYLTLINILTTTLHVV